MTRATFPGGFYAIALPDGSRIVEYADRIEINGQPIPRTGVLALVAKRINGTIYLAGQGHDDGLCWLWDEANWQSLGPTHGVRPCAFGSDSLFFSINPTTYRRIRLPSGEASDHPLAIGSQGLRYVNGDIPVAGDATLFDGTVHEFTDRGDVRVGQGHSGGCLINGRMLEQGDCQFINCERDGDSIAVGIVKFLEGQSVLHFLTRAEVDTLLFQVPPVEPPPVVTPPPEPPTMIGITDSQFATLERIRAKYGETLNEAEIGALLNEVAWIHRAEGVGMQRKDGGTNATQPRTGIKVWRGMRFAGDIGQDVLGAASIGKCIPVRGFADKADPNTFVAPVEPEGVPEPEPTPTPNPTPNPTPPPSGDFEARIHLLEQTVSRIISTMHSV